MKPCLLLAFFCFIGNCNLFAQTNVITGKVITDKDAPLTDARVMISGTGIGVLTDSTGRFVLTNVPAGPVKVIVSYLGYINDTIQQNVKGADIDLGRILLKSAAKSLNEVEVTADYNKGSENKAINMTRNSGRVVTVLSSETMKKLPDKNAAESVKRIAGAGVQNNKGEGAYISLRGTPLDWTATLVNGDRLPVADEENTSRIFEFEVFPSELIDYVEVNRTVTPDIEGDNIGGAINFLTKSAVDKRTLKIDAAVGASILAQRPTGQVNFLWGDRTKNGKFSYVINGSWFGRYYASHTYKLAFGSNYNHGLNRLELKDYEGTRHTTGANFAWEYKISNNVRIGQKLMFGSMLEDKWQRKTMYVWASGDGKSVRLQSIHGKLNRILGGGEMYGEFKIGSRVKINARISSYHNQFTFGNVPYSKKDPRNGYYTMEFGLRSVFVFTDIDTIDLFGNAYTGDSGQVPFPTKLIGDDNPNGNGDDYRNIQPKITTPLVADSFEFKRAFTELNTTRETDPVVAQLDLHVNITDKVKLQLGGKFRWKFGERRISFHEHLLNITNQQSSEPIYMMDLQTEPFNEKGGFLKPYGSPYEGTFLPFIMRDQNREFLDQYGYRLRERYMTEKNPSFREWVGSTYTYREYQSAGYVMVDARIDSKFQIIGGVRVEYTDIHVESDTLSSKYALDTASGTIYYPAEKRYTDIKYPAILPAINFNYTINDKMMLRAAVSRTYHRQNFAETKPGFAVIRYNEFEFIFGNPKLKPAYSYNFDLMYEYYWGNKGMFSIGTYYKYITDHIFGTQQSDFDQRTGIVFKGYTNAGKSWVWGAEANIQRKFDFIPSWGGGFGINANLTYSLSRMQVPGREKKQSMAEQTPLLYNVSLFYEKYGVNARVALNYTGPYLKELNLASVKGIGLIHKDTDFDIFQAETYSLDFMVGYDFKDHFTVFIEFNNLLNYPFVEYRGKRERPVRTEFYGQRGQVGFRYEM